MIGDCLLECELEPGEKRTLAGFENHAGITVLDEGAEPLGRVFRVRQRRRERLRGLPRRERDRHVPPRPTAPAEPMARRLAPRPGARPPPRRGAELEPLADELEAAALRSRRNGRDRGAGASSTRATRGPAGHPPLSRVSGRFARVCDGDRMVTFLTEASEALRGPRGPRAARGTPRGHPGASGPGTAGWADGARSRPARPPRTAGGRARRRLRGHRLERAPLEVAGEDDVDDVLRGETPPRGDRVDDRDRAFDRDPSSIPTSSASSR